MKVILLQDVKGQGKAGTIVNVSDGYARNFLFPKKLAKAADATSINAIKTRQRAEQHKKDEEEKDARELAKKLNGIIVDVKVKTGDKGRLFGSVSNAEVAKAISQQTGKTIDKRKITIKEHIKAVGIYPISVKVYAGIATEMKVNIIADK